MRLKGKKVFEASDGFLSTNIELVEEYKEKYFSQRIITTMEE